MENEKLRWEKDFSHNWNILKNVNTNIMNMSVDNEKNPISPVNDAISNMSAITTCLDELSSYKDEITNRTKLTENLSYNFNYFRNLIIVIDLTEKMNMNDYKPTRHKFLFNKLEYLITNFFKYNFISTITIITIKNYLATITSTYSSDPSVILENLKRETEPEGFPSIYNALTVSIDYLSVLEKFDNDIVFFYSSQNSLDRGNVYDLIEFFCESKTEVHFFTFESPFELLKTITKNTGGVLYQSKNVDDIDIFMNYVIFKKSKMKTALKIRFPELKQRETHDILCWCHNRVCNMYYQCADCSNTYCKLPAYCKLCNSVLLNDLFLYQLISSNKAESLPSEKFDCASVPVFFNTFLHDKKFKINNKMISFTLDGFHEFWSRYLDTIKNISKKDAFQSEKDSDLLDLKKMILFTKFSNGDKLYSNMDKVFIFKQNFNVFCTETQGFYLRETIVCNGCESIPEKNKLKSINNYANFFVCSNCTEILCVCCVQYIRNNNLGCLNCSSL